MIDNLNKIEEVAIKKFLNNKAMVGAVKKVLLADIYKVGRVEQDKELEPRKNWVYGLMMNEAGQDFKISNEELGEKVKTIVEGTRAIELAFKEMEKLIEEPVKQIEETNEAR